MSYKTGIKILFFLLIFYLGQYVLVHGCPDYLLYFNLIISSVIFFIITLESRVGILLTFIVCLSFIIVQAGPPMTFGIPGRPANAPDPYWVTVISAAYLVFVSIVAMAEKKKIDAIKNRFKESFIAMKSEVLVCDRTLAWEKKRIAEIENEIIETEGLYVFSKSLENVISKDDLVSAVKDGFKRINFSAEYIFYVNNGLHYDFFFSNMPDPGSVQSLLDENLWITKSDFVEINETDTHWSRYWGKVFPGAKAVFIYPMKVMEERLGFIIYVFSAPVISGRVVSVSNEITLGMKKVLLYEKVKELSRRDSLTGLNIRRHFFDKFEEELKRAKRYKTEISMLMTDLDHFKKINDTYGHQAGDLVLKAVSSVLTESISVIDFAGRYGGEEFCILLINSSRENTLMTAEKIRDRVSKLTIKYKETEIKVTISAGVSFFPQDGLDSAELVRKADSALYTAKSTGRNKIVVFGLQT